MTAAHETAYPRLKAEPTAKELEDYTPTETEIAFARKTGASAVARLAILIQLRVHHRLGYFLPVSTVPAPIVAHLVRFTRLRKPDLDAALGNL